jgi:tight adherence protein C
MSTELLIALAGLFLSVALVSGGVASLVLTRTSLERRRLNELIGGRSPSVRLERLQLRQDVDPALNRLRRFIPRSPKDLNRLRRRLTLAGYEDAGAVAIYAAAEVALPAVLGLAPLLLTAWPRSLLYAVICAIVGYLLPGVWLSRRLEARQAKIRNGLPDALDLFIVCVESGSVLDQAIAKASQELRLAHPVLSEELQLITTEIRAGKPRIDAFRNFATRTKVDDVQSLVSMLVQTDRFGTSIAQALRTHAETSRTKRRQRAEERAAKLGVKLVFPLVLCLFPALYVVTLGPAIIQFVRVFFNQAGR